MKTKSKFVLLNLVLLVLIVQKSMAQTPGFIFEPSSGGSSVFDPNGDGFVSQSSLGFSNDGYDVDEFEITMFPMPTLGNGEPIGDLSSGPTCGFTDMSFDINGEATYAAIDSLNNLLFRFRLSSAAPNAKGYSVLIDTDGLIGSADPNSTAENPGFEVAITLISKHGVYIYDVDGQTDCSIEKKVYAGNLNYQKTSTIAGVCGNQDVFYDFYIPFSDLTTFFGITTSTPLRFVSTTNTSASCAFQGSLSDIGGVDDEAYGGCAACAFVDLVNSVPPVPMDSLCNACSGFLPPYSDCPIINQPVVNGATNISGTADPLTTVYYKIYNSIGTLLIQDSTVADGAGIWTSSAISPAINSNDSIVLGSQTPGKSRSDNCTFAIGGAQCTASPLDNGTIVIDSKGICGGAGNALNGSEIRVYKDGMLQNPGSGTPAPIIVAADGSWIWKCNNNSGCNGGPNCVTSGVYFITQQLSGECESQATVVCYNTGGTAATPIINTPVIATDVSVSGTSTALESIYLFINGELIGTTTSNGSGIWSVSGLSLKKCDTINARATSNSLCISAYSSTVTVSGSSLAPTLNCENVYNDLNLSGTGIGELNDTVFITVYDVSAGINNTDTAYLTAFNNWAHTLRQPLDVGDSIKVKLLATCSLLSEFSNTCIIPDTSASPTIDCSLNYSTGDTLVSGTHPADGVKINLFIDGDLIDTAFVAGGVWTMIIDNSSLYTGGVLQANADDGINGISANSNSCIVNCKLPINSYSLAYAGTHIPQGHTATVSLSGSETGVFYELYDAINNMPIGTTTFGTGASLSLGTFTLMDTTIITVRAFKLPPVCEVFIPDTVTIDVFIPVVSAVNDSVTLNKNDTLQLTILLNDTFVYTIPDYGNITIISGFGPINGTATINPANGKLNYQPNFGYFGLDSLMYVVCDTTGICDTALVTFTILNVNNAPVAIIDNTITSLNTSTYIDVQFNDYDLDGDLLTTSLLNPPTNGTYSLINADSVLYVPNLGFYGIDTLSYVICDVLSACDTASVYIFVTTSEICNNGIDDDLDGLTDCFDSDCKLSSPDSIIGGTTLNCSNISGVNVSLDSIPGATNYTWTVPLGTVINSGQGTNSIMLTWGPISGEISVSADIDGCSSAKYFQAFTISRMQPVPNAIKRLN